MREFYVQKFYIEHFYPFNVKLLTSMFLKDGIHNDFSIDIDLIGVFFFDDFTHRRFFYRVIQKNSGDLQALVAQ